MTDWPKNLFPTDSPHYRRSAAKLKTADLMGVELDYWVARALGWRIDGDRWIGPTTLDGRVTRDDDPVQALLGDFRPSRSWAQGGQIIERERIAVFMIDCCWSAMTPGNAVPEGYDPNYWLLEVHQHTPRAMGPTPLIAAMRAYVASKFGEEVTDV